MKKEKTIDISRELLNDDEFKSRHRKESKFFTRNRVLTFSIVAMLILQKSMKSIQLILNEFTSFFDLAPVTSSAYTQARSHLSHTAFIELNQKAIVNVVYEGEVYKRYKGKFRLLGIDGSKVILPNEEDIRKEFGAISYTNGKDDQIVGSKPQATASVMYDLLNHIAIDSILGNSRAYEVDLAVRHLSYTCKNDLILADRNYTSYRFLACMTQFNIDFVGRCAKNTYNVVREMFEGKGNDSQIVRLRASDMKEAKELGLPEEITVRFVRVKLDTGETEILVTSLIDEGLYNTEEFRVLYNLRWGVETFYGLLKTRLNLENFTGKTSESVKQDFYATIYITGLESVLTREVNEKLEEKTCIHHQNSDEQETEERTHKHQQKVNKAVSFNAIKNHVFNLFYLEDNTNVLLEKLENLFRMNTTCIRNGRKTERKKQSSNRLLNYHKRIKKICY